MICINMSSKAEAARLYQADAIIANVKEVLL